MPVSHEIDHINQRIVTQWLGHVTDHEMIQAYQEYLKNIKTLRQYIAFDEVVDFSQAGEFKLTVEGIKKLGELASSQDRQDITTRLAIIVHSKLAFGLARMYLTYRSFSPSAHKETRVFKQQQAALEWLNKQQN